MSKMIEIRDPIHGYIFANELEKEVIDTRVFQRLRRINQLGMAYLTYPGAEHKRFIHSIGAMHLAGEVGEHLFKMGEINREEEQYIRLAALLHDLGHGPFSHTFEDVMVKYLNKTHEDITIWLIKNTEIRDIIEKNGYDPEDLSQLSVGRRKHKLKPFIDDIISSPFDVDKMDFLVRDSHFTGVQYGLVDIKRLIFSMNVIEDHLAIEVPGALYALESFIMARYEMFKAVYYHRTVRSANVMMSRAMDLAAEYLGIPNIKNPEDYIIMDDAYIIMRIRELKNEKDENMRLAYEMIDMLERRQLLKCAYEATIHTRDKYVSSILSKEHVRRELEREIAREANVPEERVFIDLPTLPSIPYSPKQIDPMEVYTFEEIDNTKVLRRLSEISNIASVLKGYVDVLRVYTFPEYREEVKKASTKIFGESSITMRISV
ncbi:MAG: HD domain-containing protein [Candidatus Methanomethylicia archaeon]